VPWTNSAGLQSTGNKKLTLLVSAHGKCSNHVYSRLLWLIKAELFGVKCSNIVSLEGQHHREYKAFLRSRKPSPKRGERVTIWPGTSQKKETTERFATLPLQGPEAAAQELTRCVKDLGFCGASIRSLYSRICSLSDSSAITMAPVRVAVPDSSFPPSRDSYCERCTRAAVLRNSWPVPVLCSLVPCALAPVPCFHVHKRNLLKARMIVTPYNQHVRLLSSEPFGWFAPPKSTRAWEPTLLWNHYTQSPAGL